MKAYKNSIAGYSYIQNCRKVSVIKVVLLQIMLLLIIQINSAKATIYTVNSTADAAIGSGSSGTLRYCIAASNADNAGAPNTIVFNIPGPAPYIISLQSELDSIKMAGTIIDATTQPGYEPGKIPVVYLTSETNMNLINGLYVENVPMVQIYGLQISNFDYGIYIHGDGADGFSIGAAGKKNVINQCNKYMIVIESADWGRIQGNYIGCDLTGTFGYVPGSPVISPSGIYLVNGANTNTIGGSLAGEGNLIAGSTSSAVHIGEYAGSDPLTGSSYNVFYGNTIGGMGQDMAWYCWAFWIDGDSDGNIIGGVLPGQGNNMSYATTGYCANGYGNLVAGIGSPEATGNQVRGNNMACAYGTGIVLAGGNNGIAEPLISGQTGNVLNGTSVADAIIDLYTGSQCNSVYGRCKGENYITSTTADADGNWSADLTNFNLACNTDITAVTTTIADGSSAFCECFSFCPVTSDNCDPNGNVLIYSNYDGGTLIINVDADIPDLKIGIVSYEADSIVLQGQYVNNITAVEWAGFNGHNNHCPGLSPKTTVIYGSPVTPVISILPPVTVNSPNGYDSGIVCSYSCDNTTWQGGCNTYDQVNEYFLTRFGSRKLLHHFTQYGCWCGVQNVSQQGTCCDTPKQCTISVVIKSQTNIGCKGGNTGSVTVSGIGGKEPYTYKWEDGQTNPTISGLSAGDYSVTVTDADNNTATKVITITESLPITASTKIVKNISCYGGKDGEGAVTASGGNGNFQYKWNTLPEQTNDTINNLSEGTYICTVTESEGCTTTVTLTIKQPEEIVISTTAEESDCGKKNGTASVHIESGGTGTFKYKWNSVPEQSTAEAVDLAPGTYRVTVTDSNGCEKTAEVVVGENSNIYNATMSKDVTIYLGDSTDISASVKGAESYVWTPSTGLSCNTCLKTKASPDKTTTYQIAITDSSGCKYTGSVTVTIDVKCGEVFVPNVFSPNGDNENDFECVFGKCIETLNFRIYDRWGEEVFETSDKKECWDGLYKNKKLQSGVYVYFLEAILENGEKVSKKGNITLIR